jgi:DNA-binding CsgD family transcriptional regulator
MDTSLTPVAFDRGAAAILSPPNQQLVKPAFCLPKEIVEVIRNHRPADLPSGKTHFRTGGHEYSCRVFLVESEAGILKLPIVALHLQRDPSASDAIQEVALKYHLTGREQEALRGISMGLTTKELADRMRISPNTVKAFLRLIRIKLGVTTRAGIVAKLLEDNGGGNGSSLP